MQTQTDHSERMASAIATEDCISEDIRDDITATVSDEQIVVTHVIPLNDAKALHDAYCSRDPDGAAFNEAKAIAFLRSYRDALQTAGFIDESTPIIPTDD